MLGWLLKTAIGRIVGGVAGTLLLSGLLYGGCQVKSCMEAKQELQQYHRADEIRKEDKKVEKSIETKKQEVDKMATPDALKRGFDELRDYRRGSD